MVKLEIVLDDEGKLHINGPIQNKILCYGLLELAKEAIVDHGRRMANAIQAPTGDQVAALLAGN